MFDIKQYDKLNIEYMHRFTKGENVKVGVLDSELSLDHPELAGRNITYAEFIQSSAYNYHGTAITSLICGNSIGVAPEVELFHMKMLSNEYGSGMSWDRAMDFALKNEVDIICMSIGTKDTLSTSMLQSIQRAYDRGVVICAPSGNEGKPILRNPADNPNVIAVGGIADSGKVSVRSNRTLEIEGYAPSEGVVIADSGQSLLYKKDSGTSFANAIFVGQMALTLSYARSLNVQVDIRSFLKEYERTYPFDGRHIDMKKVKIMLDNIKNT